jgi:hypothetical protein
MSAGTLAMLAGLFVVPLVLLWLGHRMRDRTPAQRAMFWGGLVGYLVASIAALIVGMTPAAEWAADDTVRGFLGYWGLLAGFAIGAIAGRVRLKGKR